MNNTTTVAVLRADASRVWQALTQPDLVKRWQYGSDLVTDWKPGSPIRFSNTWEGQTFEQWGTVLDVDPPSQTTLTITQDDPRPTSEPQQPEEGENPVIAALRHLVEGE